MLFFPQLSSGAVSQLPIRRETGYRTLLNRTADGREIRVQDVDYFAREWELRLELLTDAEWQAIQNLFAAAHGRLKSFLFLEPGDNLLAWSEKFSESLWVKTGVTVTEGIADPLGGTAASRLDGAGTLSQTLGAPAWLKYAGSVWARATQAGASLEVAEGGGQAKTAAFAADGQWRRYAVSTAFATASETVVVRVVAPGGAPVEIYGAQLEAQPIAAFYKKTLAQGGAHPGARFWSDTLADRATEPGRHSSVIRITWTPSQT